MTQEYAVPFHWRKFKERYNLLGSKCTHCGKHFYPKRSICPSCRRAGKTEDIQNAFDPKYIRTQHRDQNVQPEVERFGENR